MLYCTSGDNENLVSLSGIENLSQVTQGISIAGNTSLTSIDHFHSLSEIGNNPNDSGIIINRNDALQSLSGLERITTFAGIVVVNENSALSDLCDLQNILSGTLRSVSIQYNLHNPTANNIMKRNQL